MAVSLLEYRKAVEALRVSLDLLAKNHKENSAQTDLLAALRDSCIQRFEFCIELAWKVSVRFLNLQTRSPNTAIREMADNGLIDDVAVWFDFLEARNKTSHTYSEPVAVAVFDVVKRAQPHFVDLLERLTNR